MPRYAIAMLLACFALSTGCATTQTRSSPNNVFPARTGTSVEAQQTSAAVGTNPSGKGFWHNFTVELWRCLAQSSQPN